MMGEPRNYRPWEHLIHSVTTGETGFQHAFGAGIWEYLADQPEASALFDAAMTGRSGPDDAAVATGYDFSGLEIVVDVAGGRGSLLAAILRANPDMRGILFDQSHVIPGAREYLTGVGLAQRCEFAAGDFFESVVAGGDVYILKRVIHDWDDERAVRILERCRQGMPVTGRLLVVETVIRPATSRPSASCWTCTCWSGPGGRNAPRPNTERSCRRRASNCRRSCRHVRPSAWSKGSPASRPRRT
jgi:hypothetical protein